MQPGNFILWGLIRWTEPFFSYVVGTKAILVPALIPIVSEDSWGNLCCRLRPFDFAFPLLKVFFTVHLSYFIVCCSLWHASSAWTSFQFFHLPKVLIWGLWSCAHHLQLNFRNSCSQKPLAILPLGSCILLDWEEDPDSFFPYFKAYSLSLSLRRCTPYSCKSLLFVCEDSFAPFVLFLPHSSCVPRTLGPAKAAHQDSGSPQRLFSKTASLR